MPQICKECNVQSPCFRFELILNVSTLSVLCAVVRLSLRTPLVGFLRFLKMLSTHDWLKEPLIVNLNNEFTGLAYIIHFSISIALIL